MFHITTGRTKNLLCKSPTDNLQLSFTIKMTTTHRANAQKLSDHQTAFFQPTPYRYLTIRLRSRGMSCDLHIVNIRVLFRHSAPYLSPSLFSTAFNGVVPLCWKQRKSLSSSKGSSTKFDPTWFGSIARMSVVTAL
jgi:hypothetical protein